MWFGNKLLSISGQLSLFMPPENGSRGIKGKTGPKVFEELSNLSDTMASWII